jgi:hypothetical protein
MSLPSDKCCSNTSHVRPVKLQERQIMNQLEITDDYRVLQITYADVAIEARWRGGHYVNYFINGGEFACAWQDGQVTDEATFRSFVVENLPFHLGIDTASEDEMD